MELLKSKSLKKAFKQIGWTYGLFKEYHARMIFYGLLITIKTFIDLLLTYSAGKFVDYIIADDMGALFGFVMFFVICFITRLIMTFVVNRHNNTTYTGIHKTITLRLYDKLLNAEWETLEKYNSGDLLTRISQDAKTVAGNISGLIPTIISNSFSIVAAIAVIIYYDYSILIVFLLGSPIVFFSSKIFASKVLDYQRRGREAESDIMLLSKETFNNIQAIKAFGLFDIFHNRMDGRAEYRRDCDKKSNLMYMISFTLTEAFGLIALLLSGAWMIYRVHMHYITVGNIASMAALSVSAGLALSGFFQLTPTIAEFITASERLKELLGISDEPDLVMSPEVQQTIDQGRSKQMKISIENMRFHYHGGPDIFEDADMYASSGEIVALVGPSGEGKTTMLRIVLGIVRAQAGKTEMIWEDGKSLKLGHHTRQLIAYVPQGNTMMSGTIAENMRIIKPEATDEEIIKALESACAYEFVKKLPDGINHKIGESGLGLSEGQNQRLAIARAILRNTPILLLDEATSALDVVTERNVLRNIMKADEHRICLLTTHRPSALSMCNRVYRISDRKTRVIGEEEIQQLMNDF